MSNEHLYPARPGMLRRGSVVVPHGEGLPAIVCEIDHDDVLLIGPTTGTGWRACWSVSLDLRDVTARAHAAMVYTATSWPGRTNAGNVPMGSEVACWIAGRYHDSAHSRVLCRMRSMDESVTVAEARSALDWAHAASGGEG